MIPKIIHSVWIGDKTPSIDFRHQWKEIFDESWKIIHWNDDMIFKEFSIDLDISGPTLVSDYIRLLILEKYGGIYADVDMMFFKPLDEFLHHKAFFTYQLPKIKRAKNKTPRGLSLRDCIKNKINIFEFYDEDIYCNNNLIGSEPNSKAIRNYIELFKIDKELPIKNRFSYVDYGAGPSMTTHLINQYVNANGNTQHCKELSVYESSVFHPTNYIQYKDAVISRDFESVIQEQILIAKEMNSYCVHFQTSSEVSNYVKK